MADDRYIEWTAIYFTRQGMVIRHGDALSIISAKQRVNNRCFSADESGYLPSVLLTYDEENENGNPTVHFRYFSTPQADAHGNKPMHRHVRWPVWRKPLEGMAYLRVVHEWLLANDAPDHIIKEIKDQY